MARKTCPQCRKSKPGEAFGRKNATQLRSWCRECRNETRRGKPRETPEQRLRRKLKCEYGLTVEQYTALLDAQAGVCAICAQEPEAGKRLAVDHCHDTGVVRALLCIRCNVVVGVYEKHRVAAAEYLAVYGAGNPILNP